MVNSSLPIGLGTTIACWLLALGSLQAAQNKSPELVPISGNRVAASLAAIEAGGAATFKTSQGLRRLKWSQLVAWGSPAETRRGPLLVTRDGSLLVGEVYSIADRQLTLLTDLFDEVRLPVDQVQGVIFQLSDSPAQRDKLLARVQNSKHQKDRLELANGDTLEGKLLGLSDDTISLQTQVGSVEVEVANVAAMFFKSLPPSRDQSTAGKVLVGFRDGSIAVAASVVVTDNRIETKLLDGTAIKSSSLEDLVFLQPLGFGIQYLSNLEPHSYRHEPYLTLSHPYHNDASTLGTRLRVGSRLFPKGLGMHSASRITYKLKKPYQRFAADLAIDRLAGDQGSVVFRVFTTSGDKWKEAYRSEVIRGGSPPVPMSIDLGNAKAVTLMVDFADRADELDYANWLGARLIP